MFPCSRRAESSQLSENKGADNIAPDIYKCSSLASFQSYSLPSCSHCTIYVYYEATTKLQMINSVGSVINRSSKLYNCCLLQQACEAAHNPIEVMWVVSPSRVHNFYKSLLLSLHYSSFQLNFTVSLLKGIQLT